MANKDELEAMGISRNSNDNIATTNIQNSNKNSVASIVKGLAILETIIGIIIGFITIEEFGIPVIVASVISAIFIYALGEIIQLLEDIKNK